MSEDLARRRLTENEVDVIEARMRTSAQSLRHDLLELFEGEAHLAKGFKSFEDYCTDGLRLNFSNDYAAKLRQWARVEKRLLDPEMERVPSRGPACPDIPARGALALAKLPTLELQQKAYAEARGVEGFVQAGKYGELTTSLVHIVNRMLKALEPAPAPTEKSPTSPAQPAKPHPGIDAPAHPLPAQEEEQTTANTIVDEQDDEPEPFDEMPVLTPTFLSVKSCDGDHFTATGSLPNGALVELTIPYITVAALERNRRAKKKD
jgi:hypothetical protein